MMDNDPKLKHLQPHAKAYQLLHWIYDGKKTFKMDWKDVDSLLQFIKIAEKNQ